MAAQKLMLIRLKKAISCHYEIKDLGMVEAIISTPPPFFDDKYKRYIAKSIHGLSTGKD